MFEPKPEPQPEPAPDERWWQPPPPRPPVLYGQERYPIDPDRLARSKEAARGHWEAQREVLAELRYPWRTLLSHGTGLPAYLRTALAKHQVLDKGDESAQVQVRELITAPPLHEWLWGASLVGPEFEAEFRPTPVLRLGPPARWKEGAPSPAEARRFSWYQVYRGLPVLGGGVRVHESDGDRRVAVTSSYFPVSDRLPRLDPEPCDDLAEVRALQSGVRAVPLAQKGAFVRALRARYEGRFGAEITDRFNNFTLGWLREEFPEDGDRLDALFFEDQPADDRAEIERLGSAILPAGGAYRFVAPHRLTAPAIDPWYLYLDLETCRVIGDPWQEASFANFYATSSAALADAPTGLGAFDPSHIANFISLRDGVQPVALVNPLPPGLSDEAATVLFHADAMLCRFDDISCPLQPPGTRFDVTVHSAAATQFIPESRQIHFQQDGGSGIRDGQTVIFNPATDPEVVLHEFTHAFLWLLNPAPWDSSGQITPFGKALQEGYAMYLARSVAAAAPGEVAAAWAASAYRATLANGATNWGNRWAFGRADQTAGADFLPAPRVYPAGAYSNQGLQNYDVGMIWARGLWDLRQLVGPDIADTLAVRGYSYLHDHIADFDLAAEAFIDADLKLGGVGVSLQGGTEGMWMQRGITAGRGVFGFARASNGLLIAASDEGVLLFDSPAATWGLDPTPLANGDTLRGVLAVAALGDRLVAAAQVPPSAQHDPDAERMPGVYARRVADASWSPIGGLPLAAAPLCLLALPDGRLIIGTNQGPYLWNGANDAARMNGAFATTGLALLQVGAVTVVRGCTPRDLFGNLLNPDDWAPAPSDVLSKGIAPRITALAGVGNTLCIGTLGGLYRRRTNWTAAAANAGPELNSSVLALCADGQDLFVATGQAVLRSSAPGTFTSFGKPDADAVVVSLFAADGFLYAGTLAHGIYRIQLNQTGPVKWRSVFTPPLSTALFLPAGEIGLLSINLRAPTQPRTVTGLPAQVSVLQVVQPGFPLAVVAQANGTFTLAPKPTIFVLRNGAGADVTLQAVESAAGDTITIS